MKKIRDRIIIATAIILMLFTALTGYIAGVSKAAHTIGAQRWIDAYSVKQKEKSIYQASRIGIKGKEKR